MLAVTPETGAPEAAAGLVNGVQPSPSRRPFIAYFVHNLADPAVRRRLRMLQLGGADVLVFGFRRANSPPIVLHGVEIIELGETEDFKLADRARSVLYHALRAPMWREKLRNCDVILARSLELLFLGAAAQITAAPRAKLVYECLDIHGRMLSHGVIGGALRAIERLLLRRTSLLVVSSPAFVDRYFNPVQELKTPFLLLENKELVEPDCVRPPPGKPLLDKPPWRIGWFGMIRCQRSLDLLSRLVRERPGLVEVVIRGRPTRPALPDFDQVVANTPGLSFGGPYRPQDLPELYRDVHFAWAIDFFEEGQNSEWLLPNRIYEGGLYGATAIALEGVETGRWLRRRGLGLLLEVPERDLEPTLDALTPERYRSLRDALLGMPADTFSADLQDCRALVRNLQS